MATLKKSKNKPVDQDGNLIAPVETKDTVEQAESETVAEDQTPEPGSYEALLHDLLTLIPDEHVEAFDAVLSPFIQRRIERIKMELEGDNAREIVKIRETLTEQVKETVNNKLAEIERAAGPNNVSDMQKLVSQEYLKFPITVEFVDDEGFEHDEIFTIREIPQAAEKRLVKMLIDRISPIMSKFVGLKFSSGQSNLEKFQAAIKVAPEILDITAAACVIALNPYPARRPEITPEWVQDRISSSRMMGIIEAQFMANRIRDFFYSVSRVSQGT